MVVGIGVMSPCQQVAAHGQQTNPQQPRGGMHAIEGGWQRAVEWGGDVLLIGFSPHTCCHNAGRLTAPSTCCVLPLPPPHTPKQKLPAPALATLQTFMKLGVTPPATMGDVPGVLEAVTAKKAEYEALKEKAAAEPEPEEEAAAEEEGESAAAADEKEDKEEDKEEDKPSSSKAEANGGAAPEANGHAKEDKEDGGE